MYCWRIIFCSFWLCHNILYLRLFRHGLRTLSISIIFPSILLQYRKSAFFFPTFPLSPWKTYNSNSESVRGTYFSSLTYCYTKYPNPAPECCYHGHPAVDWNNRHVSLRWLGAQFPAALNWPARCQNHFAGCDLAAHGNQHWVNKSPHFAIRGKDRKIQQVVWDFVWGKQVKTVDCDGNVKRVAVEGSVS